MARADSVRTRNQLLDAAGVLLRERGLEFSLPDVARAADVSIASVYRHFESVSRIRSAYYDERLRALVASFEKVSETRTGYDLFVAICSTWVTGALSFAGSVVHVRSPEGFLRRVRRQEPEASALFTVLRRVLRALIGAGVIPDQDDEFATLVWITLLDERVLVDLHEVLGWSADQIAEEMASRVLVVLRAPRPAS